MVQGSGIGVEGSDFSASSGVFVIEAFRIRCSRHHDPKP